MVGKLAIHTSRYFKEVFIKDTGEQTIYELMRDLKEEVNLRTEEESFAVYLQIPSKMNQPDFEYYEYIA